MVVKTLSPKDKKVVFIVLLGITLERQYNASTLGKSFMCCT